MNILFLLKKLKELGVFLKCEEGVLEIEAPENVLSEALIEEIKNNKQKIVDYLQKKVNNRQIELHKVKKKEYYKVSSIQKRFYKLFQIKKESTNFNLPWVYSIKGELNIKRLEDIFNKIIVKHEILRTFFQEIEGEVVQKVASELKFKIEHFEANKSEINNIINNFVRPFDLNCLPLIRGGIIKTEENECVLIIDLHHIITDGYSLNIFIEELMLLYSNNILSHQEWQYKDFSKWQDDYIHSNSIKEKEIYWKNQFKGEIPVLSMPTDYHRNANYDADGEKLTKILKGYWIEQLRNVQYRTETTLNMLLLGVFNVVLNKWTGQEDIVIGTVSSGREENTFNRIMGPFIETMALRNYPKNNKSFYDFLMEVKLNVIEAFEHQPYPFELVLEFENINWERGRNPVFDIMLIVQNLDKKEIEINDLKISPYDYKNKVAKVDLTIEIIESDNQIVFELEYKTSLYKKETIERFISHFVNVIKEVCVLFEGNQWKEKKIADISVISTDEKKEILYSFNKPNIPRIDKRVYELIDEQAYKQSDSIAIINNDNFLSYKVLEEQSNQLANYLINEYSVKEGDRFCILTEHTVQTIICILAIFKIGAVYIPISKNYPVERINNICEDSKPKALICFSKPPTGLLEIEVLRLNEKIEKVYKCSKSKPITNIAGDGTAYIIYTSGSTGASKGVMVSHDSLLDYVIGFADYFNITSNDIVIQQSSMSFDTSIEEIFPVLCRRGKLLVIENGGKDLNEIINAVNIKCATILSATSTLISEINKFASGIIRLRILISGGEELKPNHIDNLFGAVEIYNTYGPTETTVCASYHKIRRLDEALFIGKPIDNRKVLILDNNNDLCPIGLRGEICIGGAGVAIGYLNQPELTAKSFINNPFNNNEIIYKTGDFGCWNEDGNIRFLGRKDSQIQLRGIRIELGEIEKCLEKYPEIKEAIVTVNGESSENTRLIGYFISEKKLDSDKIRKHLLEKLPAYMVPNVFMKLDEFTKTSSGKIDKKKLPLPEIKTGNTYIAPRNGVEKKLVEIWSEVLGIEKEKISVTDNFFEIGGHSLNVTQVIYKIHQVFNKKIELGEIFTNTTIHEQGQLLCIKIDDRYKVIEPIPEQEYYELSGSQKRLWILSQMEGGSLAYNMPFTIELKGKLNLEAFKKSIDNLIARHESLRTIFIEVDGEPKQKIISQNDLQNVFKFIDLSKNKSATQKAQTILKKEAQTAFNLSSCTLLKIVLIQLYEKRYVLMFNLHHIISDGWSMDVILKDLLVMYDAFTKGIILPLQPLDIQYKDYAAWQNKQHAEENLKAPRDYWKKQFEGEISVLDFPTDRPRPKLQTYNGNQISFEINPSITNRIKDFCQKEDVTLFMVLFGFVKILLYRYTGQNDIVLGVPVAGREHASLEDQVGFYVNTLALRTTFEDNTSFRDLLTKVKETTLGAYDYQAYGFDSLVEELNIPRDLSRSPLFDIMVVLQNTEINRANIPSLNNLEISRYEGSHVVSKFDVTFNFVEQNGCIRCDIEYNTDLFDKSRFVRLTGHFLNIIEKTTSEPDVRINEFDILTSEERDEILYKFNDTKVDYPKDKTVIDLFEECVEKYPDNTALVYEGQTLTYKQFHHKIVSLASVIQDTGIKPNDIVAIIAERSIEMVVTIYGIMKSGASYLPIDPNYPKERIAYILKDSEAKLVITNAPQIINNLIVNKQFPNDYFPQANILNINTFQYPESTIELKGKNTPNDLAYVIYTSGSTGNPKGVMIEHSSLSNIIQCLQRKYPLTEKDALLLKTTYTFDVSVAELFGWFWNGGKLAILEKDGEKDPETIIKAIKKEKVTHLNFVPSMFSVFMQVLENKLDDLSSLKYLLLAGEALPAKLVKRFKEFNSNIVLENIYGPTEATIYACGYSLKEWEEDFPVYIGNPFDNMKLFVVNKNNQLQPKGVPGELCIGGDGLAKGYMNNKELTNTKFIRNPFAKSDEIIYKTGDLVRWEEDSNIEYLCRIDNQVKVRGFRIELGEIEKCLEKYPEIKEAIVTVNGESSENTRLIGYFISEKKLDSDKIRKHLLEKLPAYMVPNVFMKLDEFTKTSSGKIDKKKLPLPEIKTGNTYIAPRNGVEKKLVEIWSEVLGIEKEKISINDDFYELGGHSLKATIIISKIHKYIKIKLPLEEIMANPTIAGMAKLIKSIRQLIKQEDSEKQNKVEILI